MAIKHIGYAVVDSEGDVFTEQFSFTLDELQQSLKEAVEYKGQRDIDWHEYSPHRVVKLLIDDEAVE